jgi:hypothetical protein
MVSKLYRWSGIPDPDPDFLPIQDPGVKKAPKPGSRIRIRNTGICEKYFEHKFNFLLSSRLQIVEGCIFLREISFVGIFLIKRNLFF